MGLGLVDQAFSMGTGAFETEHADQGGLVQPGILASGLAHLRCVTLDVQNVVRNLEGEAQTIAIGLKSRAISSCHPRS